MTINIYGQLEKIANEASPSREQILFFIGTLQTKHRAEEIMETILHQTSWRNYDSKYFEKIIRSLTKTTLKPFFSSSKKEEPKIWKLNRGYVRTVAENEIALDIDTKEDYERAVSIFNLYQLKGNCRSWVGAKGGHVSLFFSEPVSKEFREMVREFFNGDKGQINISVEGRAHQKTGNIVEIVAKREGFNDVETVKALLKTREDKP